LKPPRHAYARSLQETRAAPLEFRPDELALLEEAARVADVLGVLREGKPDAETVREIRLQQEALRKLVRSVDWPGDTPNLSAWGRSMAMRRWH